MVLQKENIWERLHTDSKWITGDHDTPTDFFASAVLERQFRFIVGIWLNGNKQVNLTTEIFKKEENDSYTIKWSPIPVAPADFRQIPKGSLSIVDPVLTLEGGTNLAAAVDVTGHSINMSVEYWDYDI